MDAKELFLREHARSHSSAMTPDVDGFAFEDGIFGRLTDDQLRQRAQPGTNSLAWLLWHMGRAEDMAVNIMIAGRPQVIEGGGWIERLGPSPIDIGTGMDDDEVAGFTERVDIQAIRDYRAAVGRRTREVVAGMASDQFAEPIESALLEAAFDQGAIGEGGAWLRGFISGKTKEFVLCHVGIRHNFMHIGEAMCVRSLLGLRLPV